MELSQSAEWRMVSTLWLGLRPHTGDVATCALRESGDGLELYDEVQIAGTNQVTARRAIIDTVAWFRGVTKLEWTWAPTRRLLFGEIADTWSSCKDGRPRDKCAARTSCASPPIRDVWTTWQSMTPAVEGLGGEGSSETGVASACKCEVAHLSGCFQRLADMCMQPWEADGLVLSLLSLIFHVLFVFSQLVVEPTTLRWRAVCQRQRERQKQTVSYGLRSASTRHFFSSPFCRCPLRTFID